MEKYDVWACNPPAENHTMLNVSYNSKIKLHEDGAQDIL